MTFYNPISRIENGDSPIQYNISDGKEFLKSGELLEKKTKENGYTAFIGAAKAYFKLLAYTEEAKASACYPLPIKTKKSMPSGP